MATLSTVTVPENPILAKVRRVVEKADTARSSAPLPVLRPTVLPASSSPPVPAGRQEVDLETGGILRFTDDQGTSPLSRLPDERLAAGDDWDDIARALGNAENERGGVQEVDLQPGGALTLSGPRGTQQVSRLPKERLAGTRCDDEATQVEYQSRQGISQVLGWYRIGAMLKEVRQAHSGHWTFTPSRISSPEWRRGRLAVAAPDRKDALAPESEPVVLETGATNGWETVSVELDDSDAQLTRKSVILMPGGIVTAHAADGENRISRLPAERLGAANPGPSPEDVEVLRNVDRYNVEAWTAVREGPIAGWKFMYRNPYESRPYEFFAFKAPSEGNLYRIAVLSPKMDSEFGHLPHMITTNIGGEQVPVICGPGGAPARTLHEVRTHAAKWMAYTARRHAGLPTKFSQ